MTRRIKIVKYCLPAILILIVKSIVSGQPGQDIPDLLKQKFQNWVRSFPWEEVYIHTDRQEYVAGEDLWFNVYIVERCSLKPSSLSRVAYFELLNPDNKPVVQKRIFIDKGSGPGYTKLPDTLRSGTYTLRAYTNYMKNFLPANCFISEISIYNVLNNNTFRSSKINADSSKSDVGNHSMLNATGNILKVYGREQDSLSISIRIEDNLLRENGDDFWLFIQTHGIIDRVSQLKITGQSTTVRIPKKYLSEGINQIAVFDSKGRLVGETYSFTPAKDKIPLVFTLPDSAGTRVLVPVAVNSGSGADGQEDYTNLSISVAPRAGIEAPSPEDYLVFGSEFGNSWEFFNGTSKISDIPERKMDSLLQNIKSFWIDWNRILADNMPETRYKAESEDHFLTGSLMDMDRNEKIPQSLVLMFSPGKQPEFQYARTNNEGNFSFRIHIDEELKDLILMPDSREENHKIITGSSFPEGYRQPQQADESVPDTIKTYIEDLSTNYQVRRIYGIKGTSGFIIPVTKPLRKARFYGKPDIELHMADYVTLPRMDEVFFEILPHVSLKKKDKGYEVSLTDRVANTRVELSPVLCIDGVRISDISLIADMDPAIVDRIDVVKEMYRVGMYPFTGIVNIVTRNANFRDVPLEDYMTRISYSVSDPVPLFSSPDYSRKEFLESPVPDFRNTLYWGSSQKTADGKIVSINFWTSDIQGDYRIYIQGFNRDGKLVSGSRILSVK